MLNLRCKIFLYHNFFQEYIIERDIYYQRYRDGDATFDKNFIYDSRNDHENMIKKIIHAMENREKKYIR